MNNEIRIKYGETVRRTIFVCGYDFEPTDKALFVVRYPNKEDVLWWDILPFNKEGNTYTVDIDISHADSARCFKPSKQGKWGLTWYHDIDECECGSPFGEPVRVLVASAPFIVEQAEARKEGIFCE